MKEFIHYYKASSLRSFSITDYEIIIAHLSENNYITDEREKTVKEHMEEYWGEKCLGVVAYNKDYSKAMVVGRNEVYDCPTAKRLHELFEKYGRYSNRYGYDSNCVYAWKRYNAYVKYSFSDNPLTKWSEDVLEIKKELKEHFEDI